jgi:hypothetical protein
MSKDDAKTCRMPRPQPPSLQHGSSQRPAIRAAALPWASWAWSAVVGAAQAQVHADRRPLQGDWRGSKNKAR